MGGVKRSRPRARLKRIGERDGWICWLCGRPVSKRNKGPHRASVDHVVPRAAGGPTEDENLRLAHQSCNSYRNPDSNLLAAPPYAPPLMLEVGRD